MTRNDKVGQRARELEVLDRVEELAEDFASDVPGDILVIARLQMAESKTLVINVADLFLGEFLKEEVEVTKSHDTEINSVEVRLYAVSRPEYLNALNAKLIKHAFGTDLIKEIKPQAKREADTIPLLRACERQFRGVVRVAGGFKPGKARLTKVQRNLEGVS